MSYTSVIDPITGKKYNVKPVPGKPEGEKALAIVVDEDGAHPDSETIERVSNIFFGVK